MSLALFSILCCVFLGSTGAQGGGFGGDDGSARGMGLAGALTARADDPSAIFYNPGGAALAEKKLSAGLEVRALNEALYQGLSPGTGTGTAAAQDEGFDLLPHAYLVLPVGDRLRVGLGLYTPFRLLTEWNDADNFAGRFLAVDGEIETYDLHPIVAWQLSPNLGVGGGIVYRLTQVSLGRRFPGTDPFSGERVDIASLDLQSDFDAGFGWSAGVLHRLGQRLSWGFSYRSPIEVDFTGIGKLTQMQTGNEQLDQLVMATLPLGQDLALSTEIEFPSTTRAGVAVQLVEGLTLSGDVEWTGWGSFERLSFDFRDDDRFDTLVEARFEDTLALRVGVEYATLTGSHYRFGVAVDESPQPDETVGALLADSDRTIIAAGFGRDWLDIAFQWINFDQRTVRANVDELNGSWRRSAWVLGITVSP